MKNFKRLTAILLVMIITISAAVMPTQASSKKPEALQSYEDYLANGTPTFSTQQFLSMLNVFDTVSQILTGKVLIPVEKMNVTFDDTISGYCRYICENSGFDIEALFKSIPDISAPAEIAVKVFNIDTKEMRDQLTARSFEMKEKGNMILYYAYFMIGSYMSIVKKCEIKAVPTDEENVDEVVLFLTFKDGATQEMHPSIWINSETGESYNKSGKGMVNTGFNCNIYECLVYATMNAWMRDFGFLLFYDINCYIMPMWNYITRRFHFNYDDRQWMVQIWKGNYLITNGAEVGVYNRSKYAVGTFYNCATDEERMMMTLKVTHGDDVLVDLGPTLHWWINGFEMSKTMYAPQSLRLEATLEFPDEEMLNAFTAAVDINPWHDVTHSENGLVCTIIW